MLIDKNFCILQVTPQPRSGDPTVPLKCFRMLSVKNPVIRDSALVDTDFGSWLVWN